jgi:hypothetical protein
MPLFMSTILFRRAALPDFDDVAAALAQYFPLLPPPAHIEEGEGTQRFQLAQVDVAIGLFAAPCPWMELQEPRASSALWANACTELRAHVAHILVSVNAGLELIAKATILTQATVAVMAAAPDAMGVLWSNARLLVPKALFIDYARDALPHGPPLDLWLDFRIQKTSDTSCAGFTCGLAALGLMEIEVAESPEKPWDLRNRMQRLAAYLLQRGDVVNEGDSVGEHADECIRVSFGKSQVGIAGTVMRLTYGDDEKGGWWRLFSAR